MSEDFRRFFVDPAAINGSEATITGDLSRRITKVLRYRQGDTIVLADGGEREYVVRLESISAASVTGIVTDDRPAPAEASVQVIVYQSLIRANRFDFVLEKGTEVGVARFVPIIAARTQVNEGASQARGERWRRLVIEAAEQCGRARLPSVGETLPFEQAIRSAPGLRIVPWEDEREQRLGDCLRTLPAPPATVSLFIGPEGGWEPSEVSLARESGAALVTLGRRVMRAETAAVLAAGIVLHELDR
jgi:16S rRNA (uracil1498-N3)-methyltransferase